MTNGEDENDLLKSAVVDFPENKPPGPTKSISLSKYPVFRDGVLVVRCGNETSISDTLVPVATTGTPSTAERRGLPYVCPCLCRVQPADTARRCALGRQIDHDHVATLSQQKQLTDVCPELRHASWPHFLWMIMEPDSSRSPFSSDPRARICGNSGVASRGRRVPVWFLNFGTWGTFFVPVDPASPRRARSQTVFLDRALFQNSSSRSSSHARVVPHASSICEEFAQIDYLCDFLHHSTGRYASNTLEAITPSAEP